MIDLFTVSAANGHSVLLAQGVFESHALHAQGRVLEARSAYAAQPMLLP